MKNLPVPLLILGILAALFATTPAFAFPADVFCEPLGISSESCEAVPNDDPSDYLYEWAASSGLSIPATCYDNAICVVTCTTSGSGTITVTITELATNDEEVETSSVSCVGGGPGPL